MFQDTKDELKRLEEELLAAENGSHDAQPKAEEEDLQDLLNVVDDLDDEELQNLLRIVGNLEKEDQPEPEEVALPVENLATEFRAYNSDTTDENLEEFSEDVQNGEEDRKRSGLMKVLLGLLVALMGFLILWMLKLYGVLG